MEYDHHIIIHHLQNNGHNTKVLNQNIQGKELRFDILIEIVKNGEK
jgi:hypothetical protein